MRRAAFALVVVSNALAPGIDVGVNCETAVNTS
jgi:hypothetical protein